MGVQAHNMDLQALVWDTVVGKIRISNVTAVRPRSQKLVRSKLSVILSQLSSEECDDAFVFELINTSFSLYLSRLLWRFQ